MALLFMGSHWVSGIDLIHNASTRSSAIVEVQLIPQQANVGHGPFKNNSNGGFRKNRAIHR